MPKGSDVVQKVNATVNMEKRLSLSDIFLWDNLDIWARVLKMSAISFSLPLEHSFCVPKVHVREPWKRQDPNYTAVRVCHLEQDSRNPSC